MDLELEQQEALLLLHPIVGLLLGMLTLVT